MEKKNKLVYIIVVLSLTLIILIGSLMAVLVAGSQNATVRLKVKYTSSDVWVQLEANYYVGSTSTALKDGSNKTSIELSPINTTGSLNQVEDIVTLTKSNPKVVYEYKFTNLSDTIPAVISQTIVDDSVMVPTDTHNNVTLKYIASSNQLGANANATSETLNSQALNPSATKYIYVVVEVSDLLKDVLFEGEFGWTLTRGTTITTSSTNSSGNKIININTSETGLTNATELNNIQLVMGVENEEPEVYPQVLNKAFTGWYYDSELTNKVEWPAVINETTTLYPKTEEATSDLSYTFDSATNLYSIAKYTGTATEIVIPDVYDNGTNGQAKVTSIGSNAFSYSRITSITIPNSVTSMGNGAFQSCSGLTSITIPNSVTSIGKYVFVNCSRLIDIVVESGNKTYDSRNNCNAIIETSTNSLIKGCQTTQIPNTVTNINDGAFYGCSGLNSITIPDSVTRLGVDAFRACSNLYNLIIPACVTYIGVNLIADCSNLTSVVVDSGNSTYDSRNNCNAIIETATNTLIAGCKNSIIPNGVTSIGNYAFYICSGLTSITIPNSATKIGNQAFASCSGLTSIIIPSSVKYIVEAAFASCSGLTSIIVESGNTKYDSRNNCNAIIETSTNTLIAGCQNSVIPKGVRSIGNYAFYSCKGLISITIPNSITSIGNSTFYNCSSLTSITIPSSVTSIGSNAFKGCSKLTSVTFENTTGWWVSTSSSATSGDSVIISATDLSANATLLKTTHVSKYWKRS